MLPHPFPIGNVYIGCDWDESWRDKCYDEDKSLVSTVWYIQYVDWLQLAGILPGVFLCFPNLLKNGMIVPKELAATYIVPTIVNNLPPVVCAKDADLRS